jgi:hypothetical protein
MQVKVHLILDVYDEFITKDVKDVEVGIKHAIRDSYLGTYALIETIDVYKYDAPRYNNQFMCPTDEQQCDYPHCLREDYGAPMCRDRQKIANQTRQMELPF